LRVFLLLASLVFFGSVTFGQAAGPATPVGVEEAYLAKDNGEGKAGDQVNEFRTTDIPIHCVILLDSQTAATVKMNFVAVDVSGVKADTKVVTASYTTKEGQNRVNFTGRPDGRWVPGKYRVDIFIDGKITKALEFSIRGSSDNVTASKFVNVVTAPKPKPSPTPRKP
jgi:hypothetical protein